MIRVEGHQHLYRDEKSGAIVNTDTVSYNQYVAALNKRQSQKRQLSEMREEIDELKLILKEILNGNESK
tara:strand:- start:310 stop:516 length:207 start_codon:yes stop_codon:yes gene_type:complete